MGQKVNPIIFRIGGVHKWSSRWFAGSDYRTKLRQDIQIRKFVRQLLKDAFIERVDIERSSNKITVIIFTAKPGMVIGRGGKGIDEVKKKIQNKFFSAKDQLDLSIQEVKEPNLSAELVKQSVIADLEKRIPFRRAMKQALGRVERAGVRGVKIQVAGRLNGAEIARTEKISSGSIPLHTISADIDYSRGVATTTYGIIGVKVWIYRRTIENKDK